MIRSTRGRAGTISIPVPVATSTTRRTRVRGLHGELLGETATPGEPQHVEVAVPELRHQGADPGGQARDRVGERRRLAAPDPGDVEAHEPAVGVEPVHERLQRLEADPDPVAQQQRRLAHAGAPGRPHRDAGLEAAHGDGADAVAPARIDRGGGRRRPAQRSWM